jgi:VanZ family protein
MSSSSLKAKPKNTIRIIFALLTLLWAAGIFLVSSIPSSGLPSGLGFWSTVAHFCEYLIFAVLLTMACSSPGRALWKVALIALVIASLYGVSDEFHQWFVPGRNSDPLDWATDTVGALVGAVAAVWFISGQKVRQSRLRDRER